MRIEKSYLPDGSAHAQIFAVSKGSANGQVMQIGSSTSKWKIENGFLITFDHHTIPPGVVSPEKVFRDRIVHVDQKEFVIFDTEGHKED